MSLLRDDHRRTSDLPDELRPPSRPADAVPRRARGRVTQTTYAVEVIYSLEKFRSVTSKLWPFDASTDTAHMPDMLYAIVTPAR